MPGGRGLQELATTGQGPPEVAMTDQLSREDAKRLLELFERHHGNQRKIYVAIGVVVACMTAVPLHLFWFPTDTSWRTALAFCLLGVAETPVVL